MAISLGEPVEEITRGVEVLTVGDNIRVSENAGKPQGSAVSSPDVTTLQPHLKGPGHTVDGTVVGTQSSQASAIEAGHGCSREGLMYVENSAMEQQPNQAIDPAVAASEQFSQHPLTGMGPVPLQVPSQAGYLAPYIDPYYYYPYYTNGDIYTTPVPFEYNLDFFYSLPGVDPYSMVYLGQDGYPQYQVAPGEQWMPVPMYGSALMDEGLPNFNLIPYPVDCVMDYINLPPSSFGLQSDGGQDGSKKVDGLKCGVQSPRLKTDGGFLNESLAHPVGMDDRVSLVEHKKPLKKQLSLFHGTPSPMRGSWVGHPLKAFNGKIKRAGINAEPFVKAEVNLSNFSLDYQEAKHFVIKSFSEENVIKSIHYSVWTSTANGNKKLDDAFKDAQRPGHGKEKGCPIFLYFSVNGSGRFCGVAEMVGPVDYSNTMDFWERNRWCGSFPVKWHFVKDVPHSQLRRIILQNNENKPVTSSRDTQEVNFEQGMQMLRIIKGFSTKSSILDNVLCLQCVTSPEDLADQPPLLEVSGEENMVADKNSHPEATQDQESNMPVQ